MPFKFGRRPMPLHSDMTRRARWYLGIAAVRHLLTASIAMAWPASFQSPSFNPLLAVVDDRLWMWGVVFLGAGLTCALAGLRKNVHVARLGLTWSAVSTLIVAFGLLISWFTGVEWAAPWAIIWFAVSLKDFIQCADPLRSPFEALAQQIAEDEANSGGGNGWTFKDGRA